MLLWTVFLNSNLLKLQYNETCQNGTLLIKPKSCLSRTLNKVHSSMANFCYLTCIKRTQKLFSRRFSLDRFNISFWSSVLPDGDILCIFFFVKLVLYFWLYFHRISQKAVVVLIVWQFQFISAYNIQWLPITTETAS
jgi:hypothetical protein